MMGLGRLSKYSTSDADLLGYRLLQQNRPDSNGSSRLIVMPRESGASSNSRAIAEMMQRLNRGRGIPDRPVTPGDDGSGIQVLVTPSECRATLIAGK
jgi:hypothetical protein